ncbi:ABC transporter ATP-binding protein [Enemella sp. A6]|uniref:ABC transporter ATP-binding protein n=1 Tax=Enemella sp. A6 TaxID=3440152 RepID=UPI003EC05256
MTSSDQKSTPGGPQPRLRATGVARSFRGVKALTQVDLSVERGEVLGLIGPNGAGKSTLVNIISGYDRPDSGTIEMDGRDITRLSARARARNGLARTFQQGHTYTGLSVRENIEIAALGTGLRAGAARDLATELMDLMNIRRWSGHVAKTLPHGVERRVGVARALAARPNYILLDEPAAGLNEGEIGEFGEAITSLARERDCGVLLIDHNIRLIMAVCDRIHVVVQGSSYLEGTPDEVRNSEALIEAYLGRSGRVA